MKRNITLPVMKPLTVFGALVNAPRNGESFDPVVCYTMKRLLEGEGVMSELDGLIEQWSDSENPKAVVYAVAIAVAYDYNHSILVIQAIDLLFANKETRVSESIYKNMLAMILGVIKGRALYHQYWSNWLATLKKPIKESLYFPDAGHTSVFYSFLGTLTKKPELISCENDTLPNNEFEGHLNNLVKDLIDSYAATSGLNNPLRSNFTTEFLYQLILRTDNDFGKIGILLVRAYTFALSNYIPNIKKLNLIMSALDND